MKFDKKSVRGGKFKDNVNLEVGMATKTHPASGLKGGNTYVDPSDNPLTRSIIEEFGLRRRQVTQVDSKTTSQLGGTLLQRAEDIYVQTKYVRTLVGNAKDNPARFGCSVFALASGLASLYSGDLISGGFATVLGAKELYNQCTDGGSCNLQKLLNDINADVDMVRSLEEGQQKSYQLIEDNLSLISGDVDTLYAKLDQIRDLNVEGMGVLDGAKKRAYQKGLEAKEAYREALRLFKDSKELFSSSKEVYARCASYFSLIKDLANDEDMQTPLIDKVSALVQTAEKASAECADGKQKLDDADAKFSEAMAALSKAVGLKDQAIEMISRTVQSAQDTLKAGMEKAVYTKECKERIQATQQELNEIKERSDDIMRLLDEMSEDVKKAKAEAAKKLDPSDVVVGVGAGVMFSSLGTFSALALGVTAAYAWHNGSTIADTTKKVYNYFFGTPLPPPDPMRTDEVIRVNLNQQSSGYYGWMKGRASYTYGSVDVNFGGGDIHQLRFDLNQRDYPISKEDLFTFYSSMMVKLGDGRLKPERCKEILGQLESSVVSRGGLNPNVKGLIKERQAANGLVKALHQYCDKLLQQHKA